MGDHRCPGREHHPKHCTTGGSISKSSEKYIPYMASLIHKAWKAAAEQWELWYEPDMEPDTAKAHSQAEPEPGWDDHSWEAPAMPVRDSPYDWRT